MIASPVFAGKSYAVLGLARSGLASVATLAASGARVLAWDNREEARAAVVARFGSRVEIADPLLAPLEGFAGIVVSPGVPLNRHPIAGAARAAGVPLMGDIELFAQARPSLPAHKVVGITGTNGKSTTTALVHHMLESAGVSAIMGGNIGLPILAQQPLPAGGVYVLELSSYQLDLTSSLNCDIAVLLNITPDHLDRYDGEMKRYANSKARLFTMQRSPGVAIVSIGDTWSAAIASDVAAAGRGQELRKLAAGGCMDQSRWPALQGPHNAQNALAAIAVGEALGLDPATIEQGLRTYPGLPHRMERVAESGGVLYVNDSKATNPASTAPALAAYPRIHWIVGGLPKGDDLDACKPHFDHIVAAYTIGEAGPRFAELLTPVVPVRRSELLCEAVCQAMAAARPGEVVMLSPACASFDQFRDFEARGDAFRDIVKALLSRGPEAATCLNGARA